MRYSEEVPGRAVAPPSPLLAVPNVTWPPSAILNFKSGCHGVPSVLLCTKFRQNQMIFSLRYGDFKICNMAAVRHLEF